MISLHRILPRGFSAYDHAWCFFPLGQSTFYQKDLSFSPSYLFLLHMYVSLSLKNSYPISCLLSGSGSHKGDLEKSMGCGIRDTGYGIRDTGYEGRDSGYRVPSTEYRVRDTGFIKNDQSPYSNMGTPKCHLLHVLEIPTVGTIFSPTYCTSLQNFLLIQTMVPRGTYPAAAYRVAVWGC